MVEKISAEQAYINAVMQKLPNVENKKVHTLKYGESLWGIAKKTLGKEATNQEISNYMLLIAKLNNLTTIEAMNSLKASQKIYVPTDTKLEQKKELNSTEKSVQKVIEELKSDPNARAEKAPLILNSVNLYHIYTKYENKKTGYTTNYHPIASVTTDKQGNIQEVAFNDIKRFNPYGYDYTMTANGDVKNEYTRKKAATISHENLEQMFSACKNLIEESKNRPRYQSKF